jgi:integrase
MERTSIAKTIMEYRRILKAEIYGSGFGALKAKDGSAHRLPGAFGKVTDEERTLTDDELAAVLLRSGEVSPVASAYVRILALCGTRRTETALAKWKHLSLEEKSPDGNAAPVWVIPPENRKGRAGKKRGLVVPLSLQARRMFEDLKRTSGDGDWIFSASPRANLSANFGRLGAALKKVTGVAFGFHALRATCATGAGRLGAPPHVIALLLGHKGVPGTPHVTSLYDRADRLPEVRQALDRWGEHVEELSRKASKIPKAATPPGTRGRFAVAS